jgi:hypothetical protein
MRYVYNILVGKPKRRDHSQDLDVDGTTILERIKSSRMICARHLVRMGELRNSCKTLVGKPGDHSEDIAVDGSIILEWILRK